MSRHTTPRPWPLFLNACLHAVVAAGLTLVMRASILEADGNGASAVPFLTALPFAVLATVQALALTRRSPDLALSASILCGLLSLSLAFLTAMLCLAALGGSTHLDSPIVVTLATLFALVTSTQAYCTYANLRFARALRRRSLSSTHCPTCGYDLRATPTRCPECGNSPTPTGSPT